MNLVHYIAVTVFYEAPEGQIVYRPWGRFGRCYRLTPAQRLVRARILVGYFAVTAVATLSYLLYFIFYYRFFPSLVDIALTVMPLVIAGTVVLCSFLTGGLPTSEHPPPVPISYRREMFHRADRMMDTILLSYFLITALACSATAVWLGIELGEWVVALGGALFGVGSVLLGVWRLRRRK